MKVIQYMFNLILMSSNYDRIVFISKLTKKTMLGLVKFAKYINALITLRYDSFELNNFSFSSLEQNKFLFTSSEQTIIGELSECDLSI